MNAPSRSALGLRVLTALALAVILGGTILFAPAWAAAALLGLVALIGAWEWSAFLLVSMPRRRLYWITFPLLAALASPWLANSRVMAAIAAVAVLWWFVALYWLLRGPDRIGTAAAAVAGWLSLIPTWLALVHLRIALPRGSHWVMFVLILVVAADTGAYFAGRALGRHKLAPQVSPNKTWEGAVGGVLLALVIACAGARWFHIPGHLLIPGCLIASVLSIVGDLTESLLKRHAHLKDSGTLFPGHGGVLDRMDSVNAASPTMVLWLALIGVLAS